MGFESLLGNERLKENLRVSVGRGRFSHFYLISGPEGSGKHTLARLLAAAILCQGENAPCGSCAACRKVMAGTHPDYITVDDPEHKNVAVKLVRDAREDMYIRPNEGSHKIYLFPQSMGIEGQNALLKVLEEPPAYGVFILLADNPQTLLPTVRSRCTELKLNALSKELLQKELSRRFPAADPDSILAVMDRSGGYLGQAITLLQEGVSDEKTEVFVKSLVQKDSWELTKLLAGMEKWKRDQILPVLESWKDLLQNALVCRSGVQAVSPLSRQLAMVRSPQELMNGISALQKTIEYVQGNVSVAAACGYLTWALR
ncbi:MAG: DNA polymerase III subunit [Oscillospiraceae bacterium]|nr:DNA polymerase III subunit [Oscillospiraceae bacterium]MBQ7341513.1 DNA polymerase III subunit [Oscillospiraceae bacterium]